MESVEISILPNGDIRFCRLDPETNKATFELLSEVSPERAEEIRRFLDGANSIEHIFGNEPLCG
jgi:hypothetical protein